MAALLRRAGHHVQSPRVAGTAGVSDHEPLEYAARHGYTLLTKDPEDFIDLHTQWQPAHRPHSGILLIYEEKDASKRMGRSQIVAAIGHLLASGLPIANEVHILNHWR